MPNDDNPPIKVIPVYLPQFHRIPENDEWWGAGFTEWTNVKKARPLFEGHYQPRIPLNDNYYDLSRVETLRWQSKIAKEHGIYGFCFYHYWFNKKLLLERPMEMLLENKDIEIKFCISWANHNWDNSWTAAAGRETTLISHDFDNEEDWLAHFNYLLKFFKDPRYIVEDNKPIMIIYIPNIIRKLGRLINCWNELALQSGFDGLKLVFQSPMSSHTSGWDRDLFDHSIEFQPGYANYTAPVYPSWLRNYSGRLKKFFGIKRKLLAHKKFRTFDYDQTWKKILDARPSSAHAIPSAFVDWDNTPRKMERGSVCVGASPEKFETYFGALVQKTINEYKQDKVFVFAWNEWAEGGYLEPDAKFGFGYLRAIKSVVDKLKN